MPRRKTVAVDVDGVLAQYDGWKGIDVIGDPIPGAVEFTKKLGEKYEVLIYTTRCCLEQHVSAEDLNETVGSLVDRVRKWLDKWGFHYDRIWYGQGKPIYTAIIDDRAVSCQPQPLLDRNRAYQKALSEVENML